MFLTGEEIFNDICETKTITIYKPRTDRPDVLLFTYLLSQHELFNKTISSIKVNFITTENDNNHIFLEYELAFGEINICRKEITNGDELIPSGMLLITSLLHKLNLQPKIKMCYQQSTKHNIDFVKFIITYVDFKKIKFDVDDTIIFNDIDINGNLYRLMYENTTVRFVRLDKPLNKSELVNIYQEEFDKLLPTEFEKVTIGKLNGLRLFKEKYATTALKLLCGDNLNFVIEHVEESNNDPYNTYYIVEDKNGSLIHKATIQILRMYDVVTNFSIDLGKYTNDVNIYLAYTDKNEVKHVEFDKDKIYGLINIQRGDIAIVFESPIDKLDTGFNTIKLSFDGILFDSKIRKKLAKEEGYVITKERLDEFV